MARPAYRDVPDADVAVDAAGKTVDVFEKIRDNQESVRISVFPVYFTEKTDDGAPVDTPVTMTSFELYVPDLADYTGIQRTITVGVEVKRDTSGTASFRLQDNATTTNGSKVTSTSASYEWIDISLDIDAGWVDTTRTINVQGENSVANAIYVQSIDSITGRIEF